MRSDSPCRGSTCVEIAILLGVIGALVIFVTGVGLREFEIAQVRRGGSVCR